MNITLLANRDIASNIALNYLIDGLFAHQLTIFLSDQVGTNKQLPDEMSHLKFFEQTLFNEFIFPAIDREPKQQARLKTFNRLAETISRPIDTLNDINLPTGLEKLSRSQPDLILSVRFGKILKSAAISIPRKGVLNLHSGLLPQYQGVMATFWAMLNGDAEYGTTLHFIDSSAIDAGPIIQLNPQPLDLQTSYLENVLALYQTGCQQMINAVERIASGQSLEILSPAHSASYFSFPNELQLKTFKNKGLRLFDCQQITQLGKAYLPLE